jgi:Sigma-70 region 2
MHPTTSNASVRPTAGGFSLGAAGAGRERARPTRGAIDQAALDLIRRRGREILATARRYAQTLDDADDAYQRGLEILLRKAPNTREEELVPWLKTVVIRTIDPQRAGLGAGGGSVQRGASIVGDSRALPTPGPPKGGAKDGQAVYLRRSRASGRSWRRVPCKALGIETR